MKYKRKKNNFTYMVAIYFIMLLSISIGYSFSNTDLTIQGTTKLAKSASYNYEYSYTVGGIWGNYVYPIDATVKYLGTDNITSWKAYVYVPSDSYIEENGCILASSCEINGNILTISSPSDYNNNLVTNSTLYFSIHLVTNSSTYASDFKIIGMNFYSGDIDIDNPSQEDLSFISYELKATGGWGTVTTYEFVITNNSIIKTVSNWKINYAFPIGSTISSCWDARYSYNSDTGVLSLSNPLWPVSLLPLTFQTAYIHVDTTKDIGYMPKEVGFSATTLF